MNQSDINRKTERFDLAGRREHLVPPEIIQKTKAVRYPSAAAKKIYAKIIKTLKREDAEALAAATTPEEIEAASAVTTYKVQFLGEEYIAEWVETGHSYVKVDTVKYTPAGETEPQYYECTKPHTSEPAKNPANVSYWKSLGVGIDAGVSGYSGNLLETVPWFPVDGIVEVVQIPDYDDSGQPVEGTAKWYISETVTKTETNSDSSRKYSIMWNETDKRAMAVFK